MNTNNCKGALKNACDKAKVISLTHKNVAIRNTEFVGNERFSDMTFYVEQENIDIPAHRVIVATASNVLDKFINGTGSINPSNQITVTDISSKDFLEVLRYIYTDDITVKENNALDILRVANYFDLPQLEEQCVEVVTGMLNIDNVCSLYENTYKLNSVLGRKCIQLIQSKTDVLMKNGSLTNMDQNALSEILKLDRLNVKKEKDIFEALLNWASANCLQHGLPLTSRNKRQMLGERIRLVRFTAMNSTEFFECLTLDPAFFSSEEVSEILVAIRTGNSSTQLFYSNVPRQPVSPTILTSHLFHWQSKGFNYRNFPPEVFVIKAIAPILVYGFGMYGRNGLKLHNSENKLLPLKEIIYDDRTEISKLMLEQAIVVTPEESHTFTAYHDPTYGKFFYFFQMQHSKTNVFFGYNFGTAYPNKYVRVVEIYYEDLV